ncbi:polysaccharide export outer membrane protein [Rhodoblastus acidophilus]|uniref:polysaccharide biosynthesis/export family protein n=1 Tax=Rhodoblastus acidophilus TaxID=1074 RepID=UPI002225A9D4|nr:polysaccharide biosynthesis/export family protein [Rhodoblastus acidophilus]MCW2318645.1 polysaccharide export outer membrane protein [Rhodoblastus acidophilus]
MSSSLSSRRRHVSIEQSWRRMRFAAAAVAPLAFASCASVPRDAPTGEAIRNAATMTAPTNGGESQFQYALVDLTQSLLDSVNASTATANSALSQLPRGPSPSRDVAIAPADVVTVTVFEAASGGIFGQGDATSRAGTSTNLPVQQVDSAGYISVPYGGNIHIAGLTAKSAGARIARSLAKRAIEPQVVVSMTERRGNAVSVLGDVNLPARFPLDPGGITILAAMARSGGMRGQSFDTVVTLQRGGRDHRALLSAIVNNPSQNVQLASGDVVFLSHESRFVTVFGATTDQSSGISSHRLTFESDFMSMSEALAKVNGLSDVRADPQSVFLLRQERAANLRKMGVDTSRFDGEFIPTVYAINLNTAEGLFVSNHVAMRDRDLIVAADSPWADLTKVFKLANDTLQTPLAMGSTALIATRR